MSYDAPITYDDGWFVGEDKRIRFTVYDPGATQEQVEAGNAQVQDITGWTVAWFLKRRASDAAALLSKDAGGEIAIVNGPAGLVEVTIDRADTDDFKPGNYFHSLVRTNSGFYSELATGTAVLRKGASP